MKTWWKEGVVYQIYPRSFKDTNGDGIGDLKGIIEKLDYLKELGIDMIWLNPIYKSPNDDNGYDISDYEDIMDDFGTMEDFELLLREMHKREIKLIMDLVVNHSSDEHPWFVESRKGKDNPYRDYYIWKDGKKGSEPNNWGSVFSGSAWQYDEESDQYYLHLFTKKQPDLNWENDKVRNEVYNMMRFWLDKGVDGFRMDVINAIAKDQDYPDGEKLGDEPYGDFIPYSMNVPKVHDFLKEMNEKVLKDYDIVTVGETNEVTPQIADLYVREDRRELNMVFHFEHMGIDHDWCKWVHRKWKLTELKEILSLWQTDLDKNSWNSLYWYNHDQPRVVSRFGNDNKYRVESAKMLATTLHMMRGTPYIYQGEEIGMTNIKIDKLSDFRDVEIFNAYKQYVEGEILTEEEFFDGVNRVGRDNVRTPMQWDETLNAGFSNAIPWLKVNPNYKDINVKKALEDKNSIFYYYQKLIKLRKKYPVIVYGDYKLILEDDEKIFAYIRSLDDERILVINNFTKEECVFELPKDLNYKEKTLLISNYDVENENINEIKLRPYESLAYYLI